MNRTRFAAKALAGTLGSTALVLASLSGPAQAKDSGWGVKDSGWGVSDSGWGAPKEAPKETNRDSGWGAPKEGPKETKRDSGWG